MQYFYDDVYVHNSFFHIDKSSQFLKKCSHEWVVNFLKKVRVIVKERFTYAYNLDDCYSHLSNEQIYQLLNKKSIQYINLYQKKINDYGFFKEVKNHKASNKLDQLIKIQQQIENYINPPKSLALPKDLIENIFNGLSFLDLKVFREINRTSLELSESLSIGKAKKWGYEGNSPKYALAYLEEISNQLKMLFHFHLIDSQFMILGQKKTINLDETLKNIYNLSDDAFFQFLSKKDIYQARFKIIVGQLISKKYLKVKSLTKNTLNLAMNALFMALDRGYSELIEYLLACGIDPNVKNSRGKSPLHIASKKGSLNCVKVLIESKADVNLIAKGGNTPLAYATGCLNQGVLNFNPSVVSLLLANGADPDIRSDIGLAPIVAAAYYGQIEIVELLIKHHANVNVLDEDHHSVLHHLAKSNELIQVKIAEMLLKNGADVFLLSNSQKKASEIALKSGSIEMFRLLITYENLYIESNF